MERRPPARRDLRFQMQRILQSELLDTLPANDPSAVRSRADLRRVNRWLGHHRILARAIDSATRNGVQRIVDLGAGDGTFALSLAKRLHKRWPEVELLLADRHRSAQPETLNALHRLGWKTREIEAEVFDWLTTPVERTDVIFANLFLHHFDDAELRRLLRGIAARTDCFVALDPRRGFISCAACPLLWLLGCNRVTRHDGRVSARAGFRGRELSALWPDDDEWLLEERAAGCFSHLFVAKRRSG